MANQLFDEMSKNGANNNGISQFIEKVKEVQRTFNGDPREEVQKLLNSGKMTQAQFNQYSQMANQIMRFMK